MEWLLSPLRQAVLFALRILFDAEDMFNWKLFSSTAINHVLTAL